MTTRPTPERLKEIRDTLGEWTKFNGVTEDEGVELFAEIDALTAEGNKWKDEYQNLCKFTTDYEQQRDQWRATYEQMREFLEKIYEEPNELGPHTADEIADMGVKAWDIAREALALPRPGVGIE